jgi:cellulose synthase (UDP-forming)
MRLRTRFCYLSGFCYYVHTAIFTFATPLIPLTLLIFLPNSVQMINYLFITPSLVYNMVVFPAWHRSRYGPSALMTKLLYGWAHVMALWDILRRKQQAWQPTGTAKRKAGTRRVWVGITMWNGGSSIAWVLLAVWRVDQYGARFGILLATGLLACSVTAMALLARRNQLRMLEGALRYANPA